ncbi:MAG TPA: hypothetical protein VI911_04975 [Patescibacteria group bacterium]|nr:hypothetical protein [Patescibacteria group bacterium]
MKKTVEKEVAFLQKLRCRFGTQASYRAAVKDMEKEGIISSAAVRIVCNKMDLSRTALTAADMVKVVESDLKTKKRKRRTTETDDPCHKDSVPSVAPCGSNRC